MIKIIACVAVVGLHTFQKELSIINSSLYYLCGFAVPTFFMANGYITLNRPNADYRYSVKKIISILKIALYWSAIASIGQALYESTRDRITMEILFQFPITFLKGFLQKGSLWHFWFLGALIIVYAMLPLLSKHRDKLFPIWLVFVCIGVTLQIISYYLGIPIQRYCIQTFRVWTWFQYFTLGGLIGAKNEEKTEGLNFKKSCAILIFVMVWIVIFQNVVARVLIHDLHAEYFYDSIFTVIWLILIFSLVDKMKITARQAAVIEKISPLTMGIYIVHPLVLRLTNVFMLADTLLKSILLFTIVLFVSALIVYAITKIPAANKLVKL